MLADLREQAEKHLFVCLFFHSTATFFKALVKLHIADCALLEASLFSLFYHFHTLRCWFSTFSVCQRARRTTNYTSVAAEGHTDTKSMSLNSGGRLVLVDRLRGVEFGISLTEKKKRHPGESRSSNLSTDQLSMQLDTPQSRSFCLMLSRSRRHCDGQRASWRRSKRQRCETVPKQVSRKRQIKFFSALRLPLSACLSHQVHV